MQTEIQITDFWCWDSLNETMPIDTNVCPFCGKTVSIDEIKNDECGFCELRISDN